MPLAESVARLATAIAPRATAVASARANLILVATCEQDAVLSSTDRAILRFLARRGRATASQVAAGCAMAEAEAGMHLVALEFLRLVEGRQDTHEEATERVFSVTQEGRRAATATRA